MKDKVKIVFNKITKVLNLLMNIFGVITIITAILYALNIIQPRNYKFDLITFMICTGIFFTFLELNQIKTNDK